MAVYIDPLMPYGTSATWRHTHSCHLFADGVDELHLFADRLGLRRAWFQNKPRGRDGRVFPHYDLTAGKRWQAVRFGAIELDHRAAMAKWIELGFISPKLAEGVEHV